MEKITGNELIELIKSNNNKKIVVENKEILNEFDIYKIAEEINYKVSSIKSEMIDKVLNDMDIRIFEFELEYIIDKKIEFKNCVFIDRINYYSDNWVIEKETSKDNLTTSTFNSNLIFTNCIFYKDIKLRYSEFKRSLKYVDCKFNCNIDIEDFTIFGDIEMRNNIFTKNHIQISCSNIYNNLIIVNNELCNLFLTDLNIYGKKLEISNNKLMSVNLNSIVIENETHIKMNESRKDSYMNCYSISDKMQLLFENVYLNLVFILDNRLDNFIKDIKDCRIYKYGNYIADNGIRSLLKENLEIVDEI